jgi:hypothetical protein
MAISRMQQPRQMYGLGSFVKKAVKGVTGAVKGAAGAVKDFAKSDLGKAALLTAAGSYGLGMGPLKGLRGAGFLQGIPGVSSVSNFFQSGDLLSKGNVAAGIIGLSSFLASQGVEEDEIEDIQRDPEKLSNYLGQYYKNLNPSASPQDVANFVRINTMEYRSNGGRIGYALGDRAEDNAMQASGIMGLPLNQNPAGVTELDLRDSGGFIPPVGVKEKADDIPAMLSNNEFVFTADAVRGMGDGDVNKGAERMYSMMKTLENGGRV